MGYKSLKDFVVCQQVQLYQENTLTLCRKLLKKCVACQQVKNNRKITYGLKVEITEDFGTLLVDLFLEWKLLGKSVTLRGFVQIKINITQGFVSLSNNFLGMSQGRRKEFQTIGATFYFQTPLPEIKQQKFTFFTTFYNCPSVRPKYTHIFVCDAINMVLIC